MRAALLAVLAACSFRPGAARVDGSSDAPASGSDAPPSIDAAPIDAAPCPTCRHRMVTIHGDQVTGGPHVGFPVLIALDADDDLVSHARGDGHDLRFILDGQELPYERAVFVPSTGALSAWVRVPQLAGGPDTILDFAYGEPDNDVDHARPTATWDATYAGVWHLDGASLDDSTIHAGSATVVNGPEVATGAISGALSFDGQNQYLHMAKSDALDAVATSGTLSVWIAWGNPKPMPKAYQNLMSNNRFGNPEDGLEWALQSGTNAHYFYPYGGAQTYDLAAAPFADTSFHHDAVTYDFATKKIHLYVDGAELPVETKNRHEATWMQAAALAEWRWMGDPTAPSRFVAGLLDEIHVANVVRSGEWLATEARNQRDPARS